MFKSVKYTSLLTIMSVYSNNKILLYVNKSGANFLSVKGFLTTDYHSLVLLSDTLGTFSVDITTVDNKLLKTKCTNNIYYNYKFDTYINDIQNAPVQKSLVCLFYNRLWLEREVLESFNVSFLNLVDTRPLLLNYGDNINVLLKSVPVQPSSELKTVWHFRKISKFKNTSNEL